TRIQLGDSMCLLFFKTNENAKSDEYSLVLVNVRDEYYDRPTKMAFPWDDSQIIGAQDNEKGREGGTWIAINKETAKIGVVLNILQPQQSANMTARGHLVVNYLNGDLTPKEYLEKICEKGNEYNGFLLVAMQLGDNNCADVCCYSNKHHNTPQSLPYGIHAFGNSINPDKPWSKVTYGRNKFEQIMQKHTKITSKDKLIEDIFEMLYDKEPQELDDTIKVQGGERSPFGLKRLNSIFVEIPEVKYGTRTWTIIIVDGNKNVDYIEKTMQEPILCDDHSVHPNWVLNEHHFKLKSSN
ncbi:hypothetical protein B4U80_09099, partial [Leptotrombidium deliense]